jgi:hypothetical protein
MTNRSRPMLSASARACGAKFGAGLVWSPLQAHRLARAATPGGKALRSATYWRACVRRPCVLRRNPRHSFTNGLARLLRHPDNPATVGQGRLVVPRSPPARESACGLRRPRRPTHRACRPDVAGGATAGAGSRRNLAAFILRALAATVGPAAIANGAWRFPSQRFANNGRTFCGSVSRQLGDDRSERISGVGADNKVGEAALLPSSQDFLDGRRRLTWKYQ